MVDSSFGPLVSGAFVFWDVGATAHDALKARLVPLGLGQFVPPPRTPQSCLRLALTEYANLMASQRTRAKGDAKRSYMVQAHADATVDGFEIVDVERRQGPNGYESVMSAKADALGTVEITHGYGDRSEIQKWFDTFRTEVSGSEVGKALVAILGHLHGTCVRSVGGVYYLPDNAVGAWDQVVEAFEAAGLGRNTINRVRIVLDEQGIRSVKRAIVKELITSAGTIAEEVRKGDLGEKALENRVLQAKALRKRCAEYEGILSQELSECRMLIDLAETAASSGVAVKDQDEVFDGLFAV